MSLAAASRQLVVLGCSQTKLREAASSPVPAILRYDGPLFRVLRAFLRGHRWPSQLSVAVLSAEHGLIGGLTGIRHYDRRLTPDRALELQRNVTRSLEGLLTEHDGADLFMGRDYLGALDLKSLGERAKRVHFVEGAIGRKLHQLRRQLDALDATPGSPVRPLPRPGRPLYFLPDWDDFVDQDYDFLRDRLSNTKRDGRNEAHILELLHPRRVCDGVLVSLAQHLGTKGLLKRVSAPVAGALAPRPVREHFGLAADQWAFADCGAFSYAGEDEPPISVGQAVAVYDLYGFDLGASVDHMPLPEVRKNGQREPLSEQQRRNRVTLTRNNADAFISLARRQRARFLPVGIVQGLDAEDYARQVPEYADMGYRYLALGSLVPRHDREVLEIVEEVVTALRRLPERPWLHLMGIFRPKLQEHFRRLGVESFDSATYFRKAWLRSDQNYLGVDGQWYAAVRVPPSHDGRTRKRLLASGRSEAVIARLERDALAALRAYDRGDLAVEACLDAVLAYDALLERADLQEGRLRAAYRRTLEDRPWRRCPCSVCQEQGVEVLIFRGLNRNKRRGAHNTWRLFASLNE